MAEVADIILADSKEIRSNIERDAKKEAEQDLRRKNTEGLAQMILQNNDEQLTATLNPLFVNKKYKDKKPEEMDITIQNEIHATRSAILKQALIPFLDAVKAEQLEKKVVEVETAQALDNLQKNIEHTFLSSFSEAEKAITDGTKKINELPPNLTTEQKQAEALKIGQEKADPYIDQYSKEIVPLLVSGEVKGTRPSVEDPIIAAYKELENGNSAAMEALIRNPEALQYLHSTTHTYSERFQKFGNALNTRNDRLKKNTEAQAKREEEAKAGKPESWWSKNITQKVPGKAWRDGAERTMLADIGFTKISLDIEKKIMSDPRLKAVYEEVNKNVKDEKINFVLDKKSNTPGAFQKLLGKKDGILHFLLFKLGPLWAWITGLANAAAFAQNPKNNAAATLAAGALIGGHIVSQNEFKFVGGDAVEEYIDRQLDRGSGVKRVRFQRFFAGAQGKKEAELMRHMNWSELRSSDMKQDANNRGGGWGEKELDALAENSKAANGDYHKEELKKTLAEMKGAPDTYFSPERNELRKQIYKELFGKFNSFDTTRLINSFVK